MRASAQDIGSLACALIDISNDAEGIGEPLVTAFNLGRKVEKHAEALRYQIGKLSLEIASL